MSRKFTIGQDYLEAPSAPVTNYPQTTAAWVRTANAQPGADQNFFCVTAAGNSANNADSFNIGINNATGKLSASASNSGSTFDTIMVGSILSTNTWYPAVWVGASATNRTLYSFQSGSLVSINSAVNIVSGGTAVRVGIGRYPPAGGPSSLGGSVASLAIWNAALTAGEATAYCLGALPGTIRSGSLKSWWPLDGLALPEPDLSGSANNAAQLGGASATTIDAGPPTMMFTPRGALNILPTGVTATTKYRRTLSPLGTRTGSRQAA